jgi:ubiquinone biosynthesis protein
VAKTSKTATAELPSVPASELLFIFSKSNPIDNRIRKVGEILERPESRGFREEISRRVLQFVPVESLVPESYKHWRPLVYDAMLFTMSRLSTSRLAPKLIEQIDLSTEVAPEERLMRLIATVPGLQKLGQVLARNRKMPRSLRRRLIRLENGIRDVNAAEVHKIIRERLGSKLDEYSVRLRASMYVEASVSAVVGFTWLNQKNKPREQGVFKVLKPYIPEFFTEDMELLANLAEYLDARHKRYGFAPHVLADAFNDVRRLLQHEVDFRREQSTLKEAAQVYRKVPGISIPRVVQPLCTDNITALTEERGIKVTDAVVRMPAWRRAEIAGQLIDALIAVPLFAPEGDSLFHADPHAGNLLYDSRTSELTILDWALTERLTLEQRKNLAMLFLMIVLRDPVGAGEAILALCPRGSDEAGRARKIHREVNRYLDQLPVKHVPGAVDAMNVLEELAWQGVRLPPSLVMFRKALFTLDGILQDIAAPDFSMESVMIRHLIKTWTTGWRNLGAPLSPGEWIQVQCSLLLFPGRIGLKGLQSALERRSQTATLRQSNQNQTESAPAVPR